VSSGGTGCRACGPRPSRAAAPLSSEAPLGEGAVLSAGTLAKPASSASSQKITSLLEWSVECAGVQPNQDGKSGIFYRVLYRRDSMEINPPNAQYNSNATLHCATGSFLSALAVPADGFRVMLLHATSIKIKS